MGDYPTEVFRQHKGHALSLETKLLLPMVEEVAEVNVKYLGEVDTVQERNDITAA